MNEFLNSDLSKGSVLGDITGCVNGNINGDVLGNITGTIQGDINGKKMFLIEFSIHKPLQHISEINKKKLFLKGTVYGDVSGFINGNVYRINGYITGQTSGYKFPSTQFNRTYFNSQRGSNLILQETAFSNTLEWLTNGNLII